MKFKNDVRADAPALFYLGFVDVHATMSISSIPFHVGKASRVS